MSAKILRCGCGRFGVGEQQALEEHGWELAEPPSSSAAMERRRWHCPACRGFQLAMMTTWPSENDAA
ncbi:MAG TPA: hypothetical protein VGI39_25750 [Polyangiaceae bacterium]